MHVDAALDAAQVVRRLVAHGDELRSLAASADALAGPARPKVDAAVSAAVADGTQAAALLSGLGVPARRITDVERAVLMLDAAPTTLVGLRARADDLASTARRSLRAIDDHAPADVRVALLDDLLAREPATLVPDDWRRVRDLLARDPHGQLHAGPRRLPDEPPLLDLVAKAITDPEVGGSAALDRYVRATRLATTGPGELRARALGIAERSIEELGVDDWRRLGALLDADPDGSVLSAPVAEATRTTARAAVRELAAGGGDVGADVPNLLRTMRVTAAPAERTRARAAELFARNPESLEADEWAELGLMLEADPAGSILTGPRDLRGMDPMMTWIPDLAAGRAAKVHNAMDRYFEAWRLDGAPPEQLRDAVQELVARPSDALARRDWARLAAAFDADVAETLPSVTAATPDGEPVSKWLARLATGERKHENGEMTAWFSAMRIAFDPDHAAKVDASVAALAAGGGTAQDAARVAGDSARVAALVEELEPLQQLRVADALLGLDVVSSTRGSRQALELVRHALRRVDGVPEQLDGPLREARELAKLNLQRLDKEIPNPGAPGAPRYPDYAELGRIRSTVQLVRGMVDGDLRAPMVVREASEATGDALSW